MLTRSPESEESLMMCGRDFESRPDGAYTEEPEQISYYGKENKMSFIKIQYNADVSFINPAAVTGVYPMLCGTRVCCGFTTYLSGDTPEHLIQMIEDARALDRYCAHDDQTVRMLKFMCNAIYGKPKPVQNVYYRMADRKPTKEDCDDTGCLLVSDNTDSWYVNSLLNSEIYKFWAPAFSKVEV